MFRAGDKIYRRGSGFITVNPPLSDDDEQQWATALVGVMITQTVCDVFATTIITDIRNNFPDLNCVYTWHPARRVYGKPRRKVLMNMRYTSDKFKQMMRPYVDRLDENHFWLTPESRMVIQLAF